MKASAPILLAIVALPALAGERHSVSELKTFTYGRPDATPIVFSVRSRAENAYAQLYCAYMDVHYADGTHDWHRIAPFRSGTHGWERATGAFAPARPVSKIELFGIFRDGTGNVEFGGHGVERRDGTNDVLDAYAATDLPHSDSDVIVRKVFSGREVRLETTRESPSRLVPQCPVPKGEVRVWACGSLRTVTPLTYPGGGDSAAVSLDLARREGESAQVNVTSGSGLDGVTLEMGQLRRADGRLFSGDVKWERVGYIARGYGFRTHPDAPPLSWRWLPGPLLPAAPFRVRAASTQGAWITVRAEADAEAGDYAGRIRVMHCGKVLAELPLSVRVRGFALPERFGLKTAFSVMDGFTRKYYPDDFAARKRESWNVMLDHRLNPDDISRTAPPEIGDLVYARSRGMNSFNLLNIVPPARPGQTWVPCARPEVLFAPGFYEAFTNRISPTVRELRARGMLADAYIYGFDERGKEYFAGMDSFWKRWKRDFPDIPMLTTSYQFKHVAMGDDRREGVFSSDRFCPIIQHFKPETAERLKAMGKEVWWYSCCQPFPPMPNFGSYENPLWEGRMLVGWLTRAYRLGGFLFWIVNRWDNGNAKLDESDTFFPEWREGEATQECPGDGTFLYPGRGHILPSVRLSMLRDAVEDYEYQELAGFADAPFKSLTDFPHSPEPLLNERRRLADAIERR